jgi:capsule synthesis protein PGA_cap
VSAPDKYGARPRGAAAAVVVALVAALGCLLVGGETNPPPARSATTMRKSAVAKGPVTIQWVGDTVLASAYGTPPHGGRNSLRAMTRSLHKGDVSWGNLEETLSRGGTPKCGGSSNNCYAFQAPPSYARNLKRAGFAIMNLANNHAYDFGSSGLRQTHRALARHHLAWDGAPGKIRILRRKGVRIAVLGFAPYPWAARLEDIPAAKRLVRRAARRADVVVVAIHAGAEGADRTHVPHGTEYYLGENRGNSRAFAHAAVNAGADLVVGSGPHVIRGVQWYHRRLIAYSTGNFAGYHNFGLGGVLSLSGLVRVTLNPDGSFVKGRWVSVRLEGPGLPVLDGGKESLHLVRRLSREDFGHTAAHFRSDGRITR